MRYFTFDEYYSAINWLSFKNVVNKFKKQMNKWYFESAATLKKTKHAGFPQTAIACLLIDTLSQYSEGSFASSASLYKKFCRSTIPGMKLQFRKSFNAQVFINGNFSNKKITDAADAFYCGMRCGVLHEAHSGVYCVIGGLNNKVISLEDGITRLNGAGIQSLVVDPGNLQKVLNNYFKVYINRLLSKGSKNLVLKQNFKKKFEHSYGIKIGAIGT
jgi:hypothetical protein